VRAIDAALAGGRCPRPVAILDRDQQRILGVSIGKRRMAEQRDREVVARVGVNGGIRRRRRRRAARRGDREKPPPMDEIDNDVAKSTRDDRTSRDRACGDGYENAVTVMRSRRSDGKRSVVVWTDDLLQSAADHAFGPRNF
jgi:hypothetical protein